MNEMGALRTDGSRRAVRFERTYAATPEEVWDALTNPDRLARWLAPGTITEESVALDFGDSGAVTGRVLRHEPPSVLEVEWRFAGEDQSVARFDLTPDGDGTRLVLEHRLLDSAHAAGYAAGWHAHLSALGDALEGGDGSWDERFAAVLPGYREAAAALP